MPRLLLIDDNLTDSARFMLVLAKNGNLVEKVTTWAEGFERAKVRAFDAILLELNLPDSQGISTYLAAREQLPTMPIVVLTDVADDHTVSEAYLQGVQDYLLKSNVTDAWLVQSVKHAIFRARRFETRQVLDTDPTEPAAEPRETAAEPETVWSQERIDEVIVLRLLPKRLLDAAIVMAIEDRLTSLVERGHDQLIVSMENVEYISNAALGVLIGTQKKIRTKNGRLHLADLGKNVRQQLGSRQFHRLFQIYDDVESAIASIAAAS